MHINEIKNEFISYNKAGELTTNQLDIKQINKLRIQIHTS